MLARDVGVNILSGHARLTRDEVTKPGGIEHRARSEDLVAGQPGDLQRSVGHDVNGVRDEHEARVGSDFLQVRNDLLHQVHRRTGKLEAGLSGLLLSSGGHDDQVRSGDDLHVVGSFNRSGRSELDTVGHVEGLGLNLGLVDILQDD